MTRGGGTPDGAASRRMEARLNVLRSGSDVERTIFFSDAVFAIAMTLLVLELRVPEASADVSAHAFAEAVAEKVPAFSPSC